MAVTSENARSFRARTVKGRPLSRLPMSTYRDKRLRRLDLNTFERLSQRHHSWRQIETRFTDADLVVDETGWFVFAHRA